MTIEEKDSKDYADAVIDSFGLNGVPCGIRDISGMIADGFKAGAQYALSHLWVSVKERLPKNKELVLVMVDLPQAQGYDLARFCEDDNDFALIIGLYDRHEVTHWMAIPPLKGDDA